MRDKLVALAKLGRIDASTMELDSKLKSLPAEVEELRESVGVLEGLLARERDQLTDAEELRSDHDSRIKEAQDTLARSKAKAAKATNQREAEAVERELETVRRGQKDRETEREKLKEAIGKVEDSLLKHEEEFDGLKQMLNEREAEVAKEVASLTAERELALQGRETISVLVPGDILRKYERIRERHAMGTALALNGICQGCRMSIRPMVFTRLLACKSFEVCAHCQRFLVTPDFLEVEAVPPVKKDDAAAAEATEAEPGGDAS